MADTDPAFGGRLRRLRERRGLSRETFGGLVGRSAEWVKAVERGRIHMPRLPMLVRIAKALRVNDLCDLRRGQQLPVESVSKGSHEATPAVAQAMLAAAPDAEAEPDLPALTGRIDEAWRRWVALAEQKSAVADALPGLLGGARSAVRALEGADRRRALVELARVYSLAQCLFAWQPATKLVRLAADGAMGAARDADEPQVIAAAGWYYGEVYLAGGQADRALSVTLDTADLLDPAAGTEQRARWGYDRRTPPTRSPGAALRRHPDVAAPTSRPSGCPGTGCRPWCAPRKGGRHPHPSSSPRRSPRRSSPGTTPAG
jgi:transcriptional regulator with XRE-family HTH domain